MAENGEFNEPMVLVVALSRSPTTFPDFIWCKWPYDFQNAKIVPKLAFFRYYLVLLKKLNNGKENKDITQWCVNPKQNNCSILG